VTADVTGRLEPIGQLDVQKHITVTKSIFALILPIAQPPTDLNMLSRVRKARNGDVAKQYKRLSTVRHIVVVCVEQNFCKFVRLATRSSDEYRGR
jgi:hypothetical protein